MKANSTNIVIHYLATKKVVIDCLQSLYTTENIQFKGFDSNLDLSNIQYLLLIEPLEIKSEDYAVSRLWKPWLMKNAPHIHLLVATFSKSRHSNFFNLADLPLSLAERLKKTQAVEEYIPDYSQTIVSNGIKQDLFFDPWEISLPLSGQDMKTVMVRFIKGHDKTNSYFEQLVRLRKLMLDLEYWQNKKDKQYKGRINNLYEKIGDEWELLENRWNQYNDLMPFLPFSTSANNIIAHMDELKKLIDNEAWEEQKTKPNINLIETIREELEQHFLPYIYAEHYW